MLQTFTSGGAQMVRLNDRIAKIFGVASVGWAYTGSAQSGTITDTRFTAYAGCAPFATIIGGGVDPRGGAVQLSVVGNTLTWQYPYAQAASYTRMSASFIYGIF